MDLTCSAGHHVAWLAITLWGLELHFVCSGNVLLEIVAFQGPNGSLAPLEISLANRYLSLIYDGHCQGISGLSSASSRVRHLVLLHLMNHGLNWQARR